MSDEARMQRTLDDFLAQVRSTDRQVGNLAASLDEMAGWFDSDPLRFRHNGSNADALDDVKMLRRSLRSLDRIALMWGAS
jgi:hypothetical protein